MSDGMGSLMMGAVVTVVLVGGIAGLKWAIRHNAAVAAKNEDENNESVVTMEAHVDPAKEAGICRNWGSIPLVSTDRGLMGGQAVGQNVNYTYPVGQWSGDTVRDGWTAYSYTLMTTEPTFGQNYFGRAVGNQ